MITSKNNLTNYMKVEDLSALIKDLKTKQNISEVRSTSNFQKFCIKSHRENSPKNQDESQLFPSAWQKRVFITLFQVGKSKIWLKLLKKTSFQDQSVRKLVENFFTAIEINYPLDTMFPVLVAQNWSGSELRFKLKDLKLTEVFEISKTTWLSSLFRR